MNIVLTVGAVDMWINAFCCPLTEDIPLISLQQPYTGIYNFSEIFSKSG